MVCGETDVWSIEKCSAGSREKKKFYSRLSVLLEPRALEDDCCSGLNWEKKWFDLNELFRIRRFNEIFFLVARCEVNLYVHFGSVSSGVGESHLRSVYEFRETKKENKYIVDFVIKSKVGSGLLP